MDVDNFVPLCTGCGGFGRQSRPDPSHTRDTGQGPLRVAARRLGVTDATQPWRRPRPACSQVRSAPRAFPRAAKCAAPRAHPRVQRPRAGGPSEGACVLGKPRNGTGMLEDGFGRTAEPPDVTAGRLAEQVSAPAEHPPGLQQGTGQICYGILRVANASQPSFGTVVAWMMTTSWDRSAGCVRRV